MFQAAIDAGAMVAPVTLSFRLADGRRTTAAAFLGADTLWASVFRILQVRGLVVVATAAPALHPDVTATRGGLARVAEAAVGVDYISLIRHSAVAEAVLDRSAPTPELRLAA
jgi:hypothetical protein